LDVGCGTGSFACLLSQHGYEVTGVDPAQASLNIAYRKPYADKVKWILGDSSDLPPLKIDLAIMTGNTAQVFITDEDWLNNLSSIRRMLSDGHLVFEVRNPAKKAWLRWTREQTYNRLEIPGTGFVEGWCEVSDVSGELVSFRWTYVFEADGRTLSSDSTLRFRDYGAIVKSLEQSGFLVKDVRDAPDRPGQEFVFIATGKE